MAASDDRLSDPELTPWQILANLGDSLAVVDRDYRIVWVREPLAGEAQERLVGRRCYTVFGDGENHCGPTCPVAPILEGGQPRADRAAVYRSPGPGALAGGPGFSHSR